MQNLAQIGTRRNKYEINKLFYLTKMISLIDNLAWQILKKTLQSSQINTLWFKQK